VIREFINIMEVHGLKFDGVCGGQMDGQGGIYEKSSRKRTKEVDLEAMEFKVVKDSGTSRQFRPDYKAEIVEINQARYFVFGLTSSYIIIFSKVHDLSNPLIESMNIELLYADMIRYPLFIYIFQ